MVFSFFKVVYNLGSLLTLFDFSKIYCLIKFNLIQMMQKLTHL